MANIKNGVGSNVKMLRKAKGITQEELAEIIGIHSRQLSKIETGDHFPSCKTMEKICMALDVEPKTLFDFEFWEEKAEYALTGTDNTPVFKLEKQSDKNDEVYNILPESKNIPNEKTCTDKSLANYAKTLKRPIFAEFYDESKQVKTLVFYPDGKEKIVKNNSSDDFQQDLMYFIKEIKNFKDDYASIEFLKVAVGALTSNKDLRKLDTLIDGMKLARKIR